MLIIMDDRMTAFRTLEQPVPAIIIATTCDNGIVINIGERINHHWWAGLHFGWLGELVNRKL